MPRTLARVRAGRKKEGSGSDKAAIIGSSRYVLCTMNLNRGMCKILVRYRDVNLFRLRVDTVIDKIQHGSVAVVAKLA
jgi:hypothetical protein